MKESEPKQGIAFPNLEIIVLPGENPDEVSPQEVRDKSDKAMKQFEDSLHILFGNYKGISNEKLSAAVSYLERQLANTNGLLHRLTERDSGFKEDLTQSIKGARRYLRAQEGSWLGEAGKAAAAAILGAGLALTAVPQPAYAGGPENKAAAEEEPEPEPRPEDTTPKKAETTAVSPSHSPDLTSTLLAAPGDRAFQEALEGLGKKRESPASAPKKSAEEADDQSVNAHAQGNFGEVSTSWLARTDYQDKRFRAEVVHSGSNAEASHSTSNPGVSYQDQNLNENQNRTSLKLDFNIPTKSYESAFKIGLRGMVENRETKSTTTVGTNLGGPVWTVTRVDVDEDVFRHNWGGSFRYKLDLSGGYDLEDWVEFGALAKYDRTEIDTTTTIDTDGSVTSNQDSFAPDYPSLGFTIGVHHMNTHARVNGLFNFGQDVDIYSGNKFELDTFVAQELPFSDLLAVDYSLKGKNSSGHVSYYWSRPVLDSAARAKVISSLDNKIDDRTFFGEQSMLRENERFIDSLVSSEAWGAQVGGGQENGGYFEFGVGQDIQTKYDRRYLTWGVVARLGDTEDAVSAMIYYSWKRANCIASLGAGYNYLNREDMLDSRVEEHGGKVTASVDFKF